eukprot:gene24829-30003_t
MDFLFGVDDGQPEPPKLSVELGSNLHVSLSIPDDDFNEGKSTLFATYLWSGSTLLAKKLLGLQEDLIRGSCVLEFGAAAGLPSIVAAKLGALNVCASDYPSFTVLRTLEANVAENSVVNSCKVVPHIWGEDVSALLSANSGNRYDLVLAAECLWKHNAQVDLLKSIKGCIKQGGTLLLTYSHHIPNLEAEDNKFIALAEEQGFRLVERAAESGKHMWSDRTVDIFWCMFILEAAVT